jgi:hypothetical protein
MQFRKQQKVGCLTGMFCSKLGLLTHLTRCYIFSHTAEHSDVDSGLSMIPFVSLIAII